MNTQTNSAPAPIATATEAESALSHLGAIMDRLFETVQEETAHVRSGKLRDAAALHDTKAELAKSYAAARSRVKAAKAIVGQLSAPTLEAMRRKHETLQALLKINMTVLATAHAVGEGIIRGVSGELVRKSTPSTYTASGRKNVPGPKASQPLAVSRVL